MVARPLLEALKPMGSQVSLKILRPPTFSEFEKELNHHKEFYHIVHFDGHGSYDYETRKPQSYFGSGGHKEGLVFEQLDGSADFVPAETIAQILENCCVPLFLINACRSSQDGKYALTSVASQLVRRGAIGVIAMAYSVHAEAVSYFMKRFYQELLNGKSVSASVAAARRQLLTYSKRSSPKGNLELLDWMVPVLFQQVSYAPFDTSQDITGIKRALSSGYVSSEKSMLVDCPDTSRYGFIGRNYDMLRLERCFIRHNIVLLQGMIGVGKTELACGWAKWLVETNGREKVFFMSFEKGEGLEQVINQIGRSSMGSEFFQCSYEVQKHHVLQYLRGRRCLLIWDKIEYVSRNLSEMAPLIGSSRCERLSRFAKTIQERGKTWVLITSCQDEAWLDCSYRKVRVSGLNSSDAAHFASEVLEQAGVDPAKLSEEYMNLVRMLEGHPLALRFVLSKLKNKSAGGVVADVKRGLEAIEKHEERPSYSLNDSLKYSFERLSEKARKHLLFLAFVRGRALPFALGLFATGEVNGFGKSYPEVFGETLDASGWEDIMMEAEDAGFLERIQREIFRVHPALPSFLRQRLGDSSPGSHADGQFCPALLQQLEKEFIMYYSSNAAGVCILQGANGASAGMRFIHLDELTVLHLLDRAQQTSEWVSVQQFIHALGELYKRTSRHSEHRTLRRRALDCLGLDMTSAKAKGRFAFDLWVYLKAAYAQDAVDLKNFFGAREIYTELLTELRSGNDPWTLSAIAGLLTGLGEIAAHQGRMDEAVENIQEATKIFEDAGGKRFQLILAGQGYLNLGRLWKKRNQLDVAKKYAEKAEETFQKVGDSYNLADAEFLLGTIAADEQRLRDATIYYENALKIYDDPFGDDQKAASAFQHLGIVSKLQMRFDKAKTFYNKAIMLYGKVGDRTSVENVRQLLESVTEEEGSDRFESLSDHTHDARVRPERRAPVITRDVIVFGALNAHSSSGDDHSHAANANMDETFSNDPDFKPSLSVITSRDIAVDVTKYVCLGYTAIQRRRFFDVVLQNAENNLINKRVMQARTLAPAYLGRTLAGSLPYTASCAIEEYIQHLRARDDCAHAFNANVGEIFSDDPDIEPSLLAITSRDIAVDVTKYVCLGYTATQRKGFFDEVLRNAEKNLINKRVILAKTADPEQLGYALARDIFYARYAVVEYMERLRARNAANANIGEIFSNDPNIKPSLSAITSRDIAADVTKYVGLEYTAEQRKEFFADLLQNAEKMLLTKRKILRKKETPEDLGKRLAGPSYSLCYEARYEIVEYIKRLRADAFKDGYYDGNT